MSKGIVTHKRSKSEERGSYNLFPKNLKQIIGEVLKNNHQVTFICENRTRIKGLLYLTNYRLYFDSVKILNGHAEVLLGTIYKFSKAKSNSRSCIIEITFKDVRRWNIEFENSTQSKLFFEELSYHTFPTSFGLKSFAFSYTAVFNENGWKVYNPLAEFERMGIKIDDTKRKWRITHVNRNYSLCETYPAILAVPIIDDNELELVAKFRSKSRLPVLSWIHPKNHSTITRCSQPLCGIKGNRSANDEKYIKLIKSTISTLHKLTILDCRPLANAMLNKARGGGYESADAYPDIEIIFLKIPNIHVVRESLNKLKALCLQPPIQERWLSSLDNTMWLKNIKLILKGAKSVVIRIIDNNSVLVHCSDGWDRTPQITSLAMFLLDPYYRTFKGFEVLIEKEWLSFGHKFQQRYGHGEIAEKDEERSPIFVQFIDCVWQIQQQFPTAIEFNEKFLMTILDHLYSCRFGTFMCDTEKERETEVRHRTVSLWSWMNTSLDYYKNKAFLRGQHDVIKPVVSMKYISLWKQYYCKWNPDIIGDRPLVERHIEFPSYGQIMRMNPLEMTQAPLLY